MAPWAARARAFVSAPVSAPEIEARIAAAMPTSRMAAMAMDSTASTSVKARAGRVRTSGSVENGNGGPPAGRVEGDPAPLGTDGEEEYCAPYGSAEGVEDDGAGGGG